jgi:shikimate kinase
MAACHPLDDGTQTVMSRLCSGKSTVGKIVASALKYPFLDSDSLIERLAGCTIAQIFADEGEESFRDLESQVLQVLFKLHFCATTLNSLCLCLFFNS